MTTVSVTPEQLVDRVFDILVELGPEPEQIHPDATFEELDLDSLDLVEIGQILLQEYGILLEPEHFEGVETIGQAMDVIRGYA
jgi:acyl carrier protein